MDARKTGRRGRGRPRRGSGDDARTRLLKAAARSFAAKGYAAASIIEIVAAAGVTKPVLYYHFENKEGIFRGLIDQAFTILEGAIQDRKAAAGNARERIRTLYAAIFDLFAANLDLARFLDVVMYGPSESMPRLDIANLRGAIHAAVRDLVRDGLRRGEFRHSREDDLLWGLLGVLRIATETALHDPKRSPSRAGMLRMVDLILLPAARPVA